MEFRKEMNGIALAVVAGIWASVAVGQGQGPSIGVLLRPDHQLQAPAAKPAEKKDAKPAAAKPVDKPAAKPATKPVEKKPDAVAAKPAPKPAPAPAAKPVEEEADEINLNEVDDTAVAAKGRPVVKLASQASGSSATSAPATETPAASGAGEAMPRLRLPQVRKSPRASWRRTRRRSWTSRPTTRP